MLEIFVLISILGGAISTPRSIANYEAAHDEVVPIAVAVFITVIATVLFVPITIIGWISSVIK